MITITEAKEIAEQKLLSMCNKSFSLVITKYEEYDSCWLFFYNSEKYLRTKSIADRLLGNAPILIRKEDGKVVPTGTTFPIEYYLKKAYPNGVKRVS